ncbi:MAG: O-antigen ligase family protein [Hyphomicrobium sp.]|jgi:O-antigen ligase
MAAIATPTPDRYLGGAHQTEQRGLVTWLALAAVAFTFATSGMVFTEPAPFDALMMGLMLLLPVIGLVSFNRGLIAFGALWLVAGAAALLAATLSLDTKATVIHVAVTLYLYGACFVIAGFVAYAPARHTKLILSAWTFAAVLTAVAAVIGYFNLLPGSHDLFTRYDRATGTFKDPNVLGPFLIVPMVYMLSVALERRVRGMLLPLSIAALLALAVFLSFSRGAWINLVVSLAIFGYLALATTNRSIVRLKIFSLLAIGSLMLALVVAAALSSDQVANLVSERASLEQSYDTGAEGRFGGQEKAVGLIIENPLGIGAQEFTSRYHHEEVHNVYLTVLLSAGWLGGGVYWILVGLTLVLGFRHALKSTPTRMLFLAVYATFVATAFEGVIIDSDHWRHFYALMAIIWGLMTASGLGGSTEAARPEQRPRRVIGKVHHAVLGRRRGRLIGYGPQAA